LTAGEVGGETRQALLIGIGCYIAWGLTPLLFITMGREGASPWAILAHRALWSAPWAGLLVLAARQGRDVKAALADPRRVGLLFLSAAAISSGWGVFVWSVNNGRNIEASLGYFITPLLNMAAGALIFRERIDKFGVTAIALAATGVILQTVALGHPPLIALYLASTFWIYGLIRKQIAVEAQTGLFIECLFMTLPGLAGVIWLHGHGGDIFGRGPLPNLLMMAAGPVTVAPLALFAWTARRLPLSTFGFLQFISPTIGFLIGLGVGERLTALGILAFAFIWTGSAVFMLGAWRASRRVRTTPMAAEIAAPTDSRVTSAAAALGD
jgi:chloramphenicol-sensitive protein RarD